MRNRLVLCHTLIVVCLCRSMLSPGAFAADRSATAKQAANESRSTNSVEIRDFEVRVDNTLRGSHRLTIDSDGDEQRVAIQTDVKVDVIVYKYVFKSRGNEVWRDGRLIQTELQVEDGGKKRSFSLKTDDDIQQISFNGKSVKNGTAFVMSNSYWKLPLLELREKSFPIVDTDTGKTLTASLNKVESDTVSVGGRTIACRRFKIDGPSPADLWFDDHDLLVKQYSVEQGHPTELRLKQIQKQTRTAQTDK